MNLPNKKKKKIIVFQLMMESINNMFLIKTEQEIRLINKSLFFRDYDETITLLIITKNKTLEFQNPPSDKEISK